MIRKICDLWKDCSHRPEETKDQLEVLGRRVRIYATVELRWRLVRHSSTPIYYYKDRLGLTLLR
eukprot:scaffold1020_cov106-Skeletonema_dohrnii-CCMP3373.AAC.3